MVYWKIYQNLKLKPPTITHQDWMENLNKLAIPPKLINILPGSNSELIMTILPPIASILAFKSIYIFSTTKLAASLGVFL